MFPRFRQAIFGIPLLAQAPRHASYSGPTTATAIAQAGQAANMATSGNGNTEVATVANGCYWGTQHVYDHHMKGRLISTEVGFTGGNSENPSYRQVCSGTTGHAEAVRITFDPSKVSYAEIIELFYRSHDPTQMNGQGPDIGTQYRSAIFYHSPEQKEIAEKVTEEIKEKHPLVKAKGGKIATQIVPAGKWYTAEEYHQKYLDNNPGGYECPTHRLWW